MLRVRLNTADPGGVKEGDSTVKAEGQSCVRRAACWERKEGQRVTPMCSDGWSLDTGHTGFLILLAMWDLSYIHCLFTDYYFTIFLINTNVKHH